MIPRRGFSLWTRIIRWHESRLEAGNRPKAIESARAGVTAAEGSRIERNSLDTMRSLGSALQLLSVALPDGEESRQTASRSTGLFETMLAIGPEQGTD